jgi:hypothetical protein
MLLQKQDENFKQSQTRSNDFQHYPTNEANNVGRCIDAGPTTVVDGAEV